MFSHKLVSEWFCFCMLYYIFSCHSAEPADYSSAGSYRVEFCQTAFTDTDTPAPFADSLPITINIIDDTIFEGLEYFQARIVSTSDSMRVRIGQRDTVSVTIIDDDSESFIMLERNLLASRLSVGVTSW